MNRVALVALAAAALTCLAHCDRDADLTTPKPSSERVAVDGTAKPLPPKSFEGIDETMTLGQIFDRLGPSHRETGSGLCIFVWRVTDGREFWVGTTHCKAAERPIYAHFR